MDMYCLNLVLLWNILFSPSMLIESFAGYSSLCLRPWSLSVCSTSSPGSSDFHGFHLETRCNSDRSAFFFIFIFFISYSFFILYVVHFD